MNQTSRAFFGTCFVLGALIVTSILRSHLSETFDRVGTENLLGPHTPHAHLLMGGKIDPNRADAETLAILPGIGPALAERIIENRRQFGPFKGVEDLVRVGGIGPKTLGKIAFYLSESL